MHTPVVRSCDPVDQRVAGVVKCVEVKAPWVHGGESPGVIADEFNRAVKTCQDSGSGVLMSYWFAIDGLGGG